MLSSPGVVLESKVLSWALLTLLCSSDCSTPRAGSAGHAPHQHSRTLCWVKVTDSRGPCLGWADGGTWASLAVTHPEPGVRAGEDKTEKH